MSLVGVSGSAGSLSVPTLSSSSGMGIWYSTMRESLRAARASTCEEAEKVEEEGGAGFLKEVEKLFKL